MSLTFDAHKVAIDLAYPTPPVDWERQDDHVWTFGHHEVATRSRLTVFNGKPCP